MRRKVQLLYRSRELRIAQKNKHMSVDTYRRTIERHQQQIARLQEKKGREVGSAASAIRKANSAVDAANRSTSASTVKSKLREAQGHRDQSARHEQNVADIEKKIATEHRRLNDAQRRLANAVAQDERKRSQERARADREHERRMRGIAATLHHHGNLHRVAAAALARLDNLPNRITVLFLASNPIDQPQLRLDEEVRSIGVMISKSRHRDAVRLESRWAVRPMDVLQAINECEPRVIHFSGHGSQEEEIVFQDHDGLAKLVSKDAIAQTLAAASGDIQLVFFNTCYSRSQAEAVVEHVPVAIGMNTAIGDDGARVFSAQFYSAIGFGLSIQQAFDQAKAALMLEGIHEELTPELFVNPDLDARELVLLAAGSSDREDGASA